MDKITFVRAASNAVDPVSADRAALGTIPFAAYQYCEAVCAASSYGWYAFPLENLTLRWTGAEVLILAGGRWGVLSSLAPRTLAEYWDSHCDRTALGMVPPLATSLFVPGLVQVWTGLLVHSLPGWSTLVRPPVNLPTSSLFQTYEAVVETDVYGPWPLFANVRLLSTQVDIEISMSKPLMQVQPILQQCYRGSKAERGVAGVRELESLSAEEWVGYERTVRPLSPLESDRLIGQYAALVRKRS